jgi:hypothetical protein
MSIDTTTTTNADNISPVPAIAAPADLYIAAKETLAALEALSIMWNDVDGFGAGKAGNWTAFNVVELARKNLTATIAKVETGDAEEGDDAGDSAWSEAGIVNVDSGQLLIGDPAYLAEKTHPGQMDWDAFHATIDFEENTQQLNHEKGHAGLGVLVSTGWGDGTYIVETRESCGRVVEVRIKFD